ncbi:MAG: radical SAM family heme chaperone HemW [Sediminibacterium sp.]|nr:radical SAM family heme chaperone HemW [Sediminibacterium sp.]
MAGIYIHIPFCKKACHYCNFHFSTQTNNIDGFIEALLIEINLRKDYLKSPIQTIYFGGGTPSLLSFSQLKTITDAIRAQYVVNDFIECTLEANPDDITDEQLQYWKQLGINRLSIGIQSFQNDALKWMNRAHEVEQSHKAIEAAQKAGFENISIDLIYGTPHYSRAGLEADLNLIKEYAIPHVSCYALTVEEKTALQSMIQKGQMKNVVSEEQAAHFDIIVDFLNQQGYEHYEISNFAKPGHRSQHNSSYWRGAHYIGLGPSAHSYNGSTRQWNIANNALYAQSLKKGEINFEIESLELSTQFNEYMMISLRCMEGFDLTFIESKFGEAYLQHTNNIIAQLASQKVLSKTSEGYCLSKSAKFLADGIASEFFIIGSSPSL